MGIRNSAKAVIIQEGKLLAIKKQDKEAGQSKVPSFKKPVNQHRYP